MNNKYSLGQIVFSKCGRDQGKPFVIVSIEDEYVYLVDGNLRKVDNPKLKKHKHIQPCLLYTSPSPRDGLLSRMPSSA